MNTNTTALMTLTDMEQTLLAVVRGSNLSLADACAALTRQARGDLIPTRGEQTVIRLIRQIGISIPDTIESLWKTEQAHRGQSDAFNRRSPEKSDGDAYMADMPPAAGSERSPFHSFRVVGENAKLESIYEGRGLTLQTVIETEASYFRDDDEPDRDDPASAFDLTIYRNGRAEAIVRSLGNGKGSYQVLGLTDLWNNGGAPEQSETPARVAEPEPTPHAESAKVKTASERDETIAVEMEGITRSDAALDHRRESLPLAYSVTENEVLMYHSHWRNSLDSVIAEAVEGWSSGDRDMAVWRGCDLMAVIRAGHDGGPNVVRFDRPIREAKGVDL